MKREVILNIPDLHIPYEHKDALAFLKAVKKKYKPTRVVCLGDEVDNHSLSFHPSDQDLPSAGDELKLAIKRLKPYVKLFPKMDILDSNHGSMSFRKFKFHGIPMKYLKPLNEVLEVPVAWKWHTELKFKLCNGQYVHYHHGWKKNAKAMAMMLGMNHVCGHYHTEFRIEYSSTPTQLIWGINSGCLIDTKALAFAYDKLNPGRPILGCSLIINGIPKLVPMVLKKNGRWNGVIH